MSQKQYHTVLSVKKASTGQNSYGSVQNYALSLDSCGEPVKLALTEPVTQEPAVGDRLYGHLTEHTAGERTYLELILAPKPQPTTDQRIRAQWSIGQAVGIYNAGMYTTEEERAAAYNNIVNESKHFYQMVEEVIGE